MNIRKVIAAVFLVAALWLAGVAPAPAKKRGYSNAHLDEGELECLRSNQVALGTRFSWQFKGYCEGESGQCFLDRLHYYNPIVDNWQCWKREDGWWQADVTPLGIYALSHQEINWALSDITGQAVNCR
ncbi:unnamed protein product [Clonostachys rosea]|uniref:Uncharacterized protein n=1 Tax=Bionectria ochroleuca TaxID=29856 RepID=A0ABY6UF60_BIOOC|nr:unnamed protein product [Clonostachys rosea]